MSPRFAWPSYSLSLRCLALGILSALLFMLLYGRIGKSLFLEYGLALAFLLLLSLA